MRTGSSGLVARVHPSSIKWCEAVPSSVGSETSPEGPMGRRIASCHLCLLCATACGKGDAGRNDEVPATLRGNYGQKPEQAQLPTVGLEVDAHALRLGELTITIVQGEASESGDSTSPRPKRVWEKGGGKTKTCKGTVSRQGNTLLVKLFERERATSAARARSKASGSCGRAADALPERDARHVRRRASSMKRRRAAHRAEAIGWIDGGEKVGIGEVVQWLDKPDEAFVRAAKYAGHQLHRLHLREAEQLWSCSLPAAGSPEGIGVSERRGDRAGRSTTRHLPKAKSSNGKVDIEPKDGKLVLVAKDIGLRCEQAVLRTSERTVTRSQSMVSGVTGGALLVLDAAVPTGGTETCRQRIAQRSRQSECTRGERCAVLPRRAAGIRERRAAVPTPDRDRRAGRRRPQGRARCPRARRCWRAGT